MARLKQGKRYLTRYVSNRPLRRTPQQARWAEKRGVPHKQCLHAEIRAVIMLTKSRKSEKAKYLYIAAVSEAGNVLCAKPCAVCQMMLDESFPEIEVFWTKRQ